MLNSHSYRYCENVEITLLLGLYNIDFKVANEQMKTWSEVEKGGKQIQNFIWASLSSLTV